MFLYHNTENIFNVRKGDISPPNKWLQFNNYKKFYLNPYDEKAFVYGAVARFHIALIAIGASGWNLIGLLESTNTVTQNKNNIINTR